MSWTEKVDSVIVLAQIKANNVSTYRWTVIQKHGCNTSITYLLESWDDKHIHKLRFYSGDNNQLLMK